MTTPNQVLIEKANVTTRLVTDRITYTVESATMADVDAGLVWYDDLGAELLGLAQLTSYPREAVVAAFAHLSPRISFTGCKVATLAMFGGEPRPAGVMLAPWNRARQAMDAPDPLATLKGPKVRAFARNILGDTQAVTIDIWALRVALGDDFDPGLITRKGVYDALARCYRLAALRVGLTPRETQAITWVVARNGRAQ